MVSCVSAALAALMGAFVVANATNTSVTVCSAKTTGGLRYSKSDSCTSTEKKLVLNEQGATGAIGATGLAGSFPQSMEIRNITESATIVLTDAGKMLVSRSGTVVTVPTNASAAFAIGARIEFAVFSSFLYFDPASGVTVNAGTSRVELDTGSFQVASLIKIATNEWVLLKTVDEG